MNKDVRKPSADDEAAQNAFKEALANGTDDDGDGDDDAGARVSLEVVYWLELLSATILVAVCSARFLATCLGRTRSKVRILPR